VSRSEERMCVNCGKTVPASHPRHEPLPECVGPDGMAACTFDLTPDEAWQHWRNEWHRQRDDLTALRARHRAAVAALRKYGQHTEQCNVGSPHRDNRCDCGWDAILTPASPDTGEGDTK
jgi:hypothetical protein